MTNSLTSCKRLPSGSKARLYGWSFRKSIIPVKGTEIWIEGNGLLFGPLSTRGRAPIHRGRWAMEQTREASDQNLAERLCWQAARRDDARVARRLYRKQVVDGVYQLDAAALLDDVFYFLQELGVGDWLGEVQGTAVQREMVPFVQDVLLSSLQTLCGIESMHALPAVLFSDAALRRRVGFNAHQVRHGVCQ